MREFLKTADGSRLAGQALLGVGGQGEVWSASDGGKPVAVKIYHPQAATPEQRQVIERLLAKGPPAKQFLWPLAMVEDPSHGTFGYLMELREHRFRALEDFMARRIEPTMRVLLTTGAQLADAFLRLHSMGLCYRDVSFANVFFDPTTGDVRVCDNDNVDVSGTESGGVLGTQRFMAPEVVRREAVPSDHTDRYSLAVLLFFLFYGGHPLDGRREAQIRCLDIPALERLYGFDPLYIWDPKEPSNRPVPEIHKNPIAFRDMYPLEIWEHFLVSFTDGLRHPTKRVRESEWRRAFEHAIDGIWLCKCGAENFYEVAQRDGKQCWSCKGGIVLPPRLRIGQDVVVLNRETRLLARHVGRARDDETVVAEVVPNPKVAKLLGLRNLGDTAWTLTKPDGSVVAVPSGRAAPIVAGNKINFGLVTGEIQT